MNVSPSNGDCGSFLSALKLLFFILKTLPYFTNSKPMTKAAEFEQSLFKKNPIPYPMAD
jgi:hypothetical protein